MNTFRMSFAQRLGSEGCIPDYLVRPVGNEMNFFAPWTGARKYGRVVKVEEKSITIEDTASHRQYSFEITK